MLMLKTYLVSLDAEDADAPAACDGDNAHLPGDVAAEMCAGVAPEHALGPTRNDALLQQHVLATHLGDGPDEADALCVA